MFDVVKSRKSKIDFPQIFTPLNKPKDKDAGIASIEIIINNNKQALVLVMLNFSIIVAQGASRILMPEVTAAQNKSTKNAKEIIFPKGI